MTCNTKIRLKAEGNQAIGKNGSPQVVIPGRTSPAILLPFREGLIFILRGVPEMGMNFL